MKKILLLLLLIGSLGQAQAPFESEIAAFEAQDRQTPPPPAPILLVGSSSFRLWTDVQAYFPGKPILNRGFGGSSLIDVLRVADRIVLPYHARQIVIYAGENDLAIDHRSPQEVAQLFGQLFKKIRRAQPRVPVVFVSIKPSPARWKLKPEMDVTNGLIRRYLARQHRASFVNIVSVLINPATQRPKPELFKPDSLHLNAAGYALWAEVLRPVLK